MFVADLLLAVLLLGHFWLCTCPKAPFGVARLGFAGGIACFG
jgi:hypothetical protein